MFLVDDLLAAPFTSLLWVFRELHHAVQREIAGEAEAVTRSLSELYMKLETGAITEEEFAAGEKPLLDRLDAIREREEGVAEGGGEEELEEEEEAGDEPEPHAFLPVGFDRSRPFAGR
ncbi:MAG: gas vesicle protein GvpG [Chitinivibrionia bacterium]|nr:gas vesicle protein GvpG [Chitinivibrionia bacterium]